MHWVWNSEQSYIFRQHCFPKKSPEVIHLRTFRFLILIILSGMLTQSGAAALHAVSALFPAVTPAAFPQPFQRLPLLPQPWQQR